MEDVGADGKSASRSAKKPVKRAKIGLKKAVLRPPSATASEPQNQMQSGTVQTEQQVAARLAERKPSVPSGPRSWPSKRPARNR